MRYFVGQCDFKWSHRGLKAEQLWVRREVGDELYKEVELRGWKWFLMHSQSQTADRFCRCDIYVDIPDPDSKYATLFPIKFPQAKIVRAK